jgi:uncharacterized Rmd1/YagE family protein
MENRHSCSAYYLGPSLNLAKIEQSCREFTLYRRERNSLIYKLSEEQFVSVHSFGVVVTFDVSKDDRTRYLDRIAACLHEEGEATLKTESALSDDCDIVIDETQADAVEFSQIRLHALDLEKVFIIMSVLAQSVAIDSLERQVEEHLQKFEKLNVSLTRQGRVAAPAREVMMAIGSSSSMMSLVIGKLSLLDKPDVAWEDREAEALFINLRKMYELGERFEAIKFKLDFIRESSGNLLNMLQNRHANLLEWIIILLFVYEIAMAFI